MVAVSWSGEIHAIDSMTGAVSLLGVGPYGANGLARDANGILWSNASFAPAGVFGITRIDPAAGTATAAHLSADVRALAAGAGTTLFALVFEAGNNQLYRVDSVSGVHTALGAPFTGLIQGMTMHNGSLYAWDLQRGLGTFDTSTGVFTDLGFAGGAYIQWLATRPDGQLIGGGGGQIYAIDVVTGIATQYATTPASDLRGAEPSGLALPYGQGCFGGTGDVTLSASGPLVGGSFLTLRSTGHSAGPAVFSGFGFLVLGTSNTSYAGNPLPLLLDPLLGTAGCSLYTSIEAAVLGSVVTPTLPHMGFVIAIPPTVVDQTVYLQTIAFDDVPGGISASNGLLVRIGD